MGIENVEDLQPGDDATRAQDTQVTLPEGTKLIVTDPHPADENPEEHAGEVTKDPWADDEQTDWPNNVTAPVEAPKEES